MDAWSCFSCGAVIKQKETPLSCPFCNRKQFFEHMVIEEKRDEASHKYEEALNKLEEYDRDVPKRKLLDHACECPKDDI
jgi:uncharacterized Zn finger protein (UPF0148 family)